MWRSDEMLRTSSFEPECAMSALKPALQRPIPLGFVCGVLASTSRQVWRLIDVNGGFVQLVKSETNPASVMVSLSVRASFPS